MFELTYLDSYNKERSQTFANLDEILLAFSGCLTLPDYLKVLQLTQDGKDLGYQGLIGDLYQFLNSITPKNK